MKRGKKIVTRFAPSPTGFMHVGGVRTAIFAWLFAKKNNGTFILRIEDTDKEREVLGSIEHIIKSLKWIGISWDEGVDIGGPNGPYIQSKKLSVYKKYALELCDRGLAYADPYSEEDLEKLREKSTLEKKPFLYRDYRPENPPEWNGSQPLRLKINEIKTSKWNDLVRGDLKAGPEALDDFIIIKSDGYPTYNFAHIIDDFEMDVTHILRADEFISSTPKFLALYEALGIEHPEFVTLPPIMSSDGKKKLGKRDGAKDLLDYKKEGYLPEAMFNFLSFIGWNPGDDREILSKQEIIDSFELKKIQSSGGKFNEEKLKWYNKEYLKIKPWAEVEKDMTEKLSELLPSTDKNILTRACPVLFERMQVYSDLDIMYEKDELYYVKDDFQIKKEIILPKLKNKDLDDSELRIKTKSRLLKVYELINNAEGSVFGDETKIKDIIWPYAEEEGRMEVLWPLRASLSGLEKSPDPFKLIYIMGKEESLKRIKLAIDVL